MPAVTDLKYRAFISYAHADNQWAQQLHRRLEQFQIERDLVGRETDRGPVPRSLRPIFRDRDEFVSGETLDAATVAALDQSACLIVLCSPIAATRPAVENEVRLFRSRHPDRPVIPVIIDGRYPDNFPRSLLYDVASDGTLTDKATTILGPDLRDTGDGRTLGLAKIVAGMTGLGTDEIVQRAERQRRRMMRNWISGLSFVAIAMAGLAGLAEINRRQAQSNLDIAIDAAQAYSTELGTQFKSIASLPRAEVLDLLQSAERLSDRITQISGQSDKHDESRARLNLVYAETYQQLGRAEDALRSAQKAKSFAETLLARQPENVDALRLVDIADVRIAGLTGQDIAEESVRRARRNVAAHPAEPDLKRDLVIALNRLGDRQFDGGKAIEALELYRDAQRVLRGLTSDPDITSQPITQSDHATSLDRIGKAELALGRNRDALESFKASLAIMERLREQQPWNLQIASSIAVAHEKIGAVMSSDRDYAGALQHHEAARDLRLQLARSDPLNIETRAALLTSLSQIADTNYRLGDLGKAQVADEQSLALAREVVGTDKGATPQYNRQLMIALNRVSAYRVSADKLEEARKLRHEALGIARALASADRGHAQFQLDHMTAIVIALPVAANLADVQTLEKEAEDLAAAAQATGGLPPRLRNQLAEVLRQAGTRAFLLKNFDAAESYSRKLVALVPGAQSDAHLAAALLFQDKIEEAERIYLSHMSESVDGEPWTILVERSFTAIRDAGLDHPQMRAIGDKLKDRR